MRISRLFQRAGAIGAASVALFVSLIAPVHASTAAQVNVYGVDTVRNADGAFEARYHFQRRFAANDPVYPGKVDYVTRRVKVPKRGNPVKWFKRNPMEYAAWAAAAAAGYAIDELTGQVTRPVESVSDTYKPGSYYFSELQGARYEGLTFEEVVSQLPSSIFLWGVDLQKGSCSITAPTATEGAIGRCIYQNGAKILRPNINLTGCGSNPVCSRTPAPVITYEPVPDSEVWTVFDPVADAAPDHHLSPWVKDAAGNPYIYPEVQAEQAKIAEGVPGAQRLPDAVVVTDPLAGQGLGIDGQPTGDPVPTPNVSVSSPPVDFPDDYAREDTLSEQKNAVVELRDLLKEEFDTEPDFTEDHPADQIYEPLTDQFDALPELPGGIPAVDGFGIHSGTCQTITFKWGAASVVFPSSSQCSKLNSAKQILGWFIYVCTFFGCVYTILGARSLRA